MYRLHCRELTILGRERQLQLYKTKIAITEIKAVKLSRNHNLKDFLYPNSWSHTFLKSSTTVTTWEAHVFSWNESDNRKLGKVIFLQTGS